MAYHNPDSPARQSAVSDLVGGLPQGEELKTPVRASQLRLVQDFRAVLSKLYPGEFTTTTTKGDGYLWVKKL